MSEYFLIYQGEKGNPELASHALYVGYLLPEVVEKTKDHIQKMYGHEPYGIGFYLYDESKLSEDKYEILGDLLRHYTDDKYGKNLNHRIICQTLDSVERYIKSISDSSTSDEPPQLVSAATGKGNRPTSLAEIKAEEAEIAWADEPADVRIVDDNAKVIEEAVYRGTLRASFVNKKLTEKEQNILLSETLNIGPTEIARRNGTPEADVKTEADKIRKQIERDGKGK